MSDKLEQNLRAALIELVESRPTDTDIRLIAGDYHPRTGRRLGWPAAGLAGTLVAAGAASAAVLLSSAAPDAFAGWTAAPATPTRAALAAATAACNELNPTTGRLTGKPVLTEARDRYTAAIYVTPSTGWYSTCISDGSTGDGSTTISGGQSILRVEVAPGPDQLGIPDDNVEQALAFPGSADHYKGEPSWWDALTRSNGATSRQRLFQRLDSGGAAQNLAGLAGRDVRSVTFVFDQDVTVNATVQNGWYFAWWPGRALPNSVQVTTNSGTMTTSPVPDTTSWNKTCGQPTSERKGSCGAFATGERPAFVRRQRAYLKAHSNRDGQGTKSGS